MTREEAIKLLKQYQGYEPMFPDGETLKHAFDLTDETVDTLFTALRPVSREQIKKMKKEPVEGEYDELYAPTYKCPECGFENIGKGNFCQNCGCLYTDEAVQMVIERLEALKDGDLE